MDLIAGVSILIGAATNFVVWAVPPDRLSWRGRTIIGGIAAFAVVYGLAVLIFIGAGMTWRLWPAVLVGGLVCGVVGGGVVGLAWKHAQSRANLPTGSTVADIAVSPRGPKYDEYDFRWIPRQTFAPTIKVQSLEQPALPNGTDHPVFKIKNTGSAALQGIELEWTVEGEPIAAVIEKSDTLKPFRAHVRDGYIGLVFRREGIGTNNHGEAISDRHVETMQVLIASPMTEASTDLFVPMPILASYKFRLVALPPFNFPMERPGVDVIGPPIHLVVRQKGRPEEVKFTIRSVATFVHDAAALSTYKQSVDPPGILMAFVDPKYAHPSNRRGWIKFSVERH